MAPITLLTQNFMQFSNPFRTGRLGFMVEICNMAAGSTSRQFNITAILGTPLAKLSEASEPKESALDDFSRPTWK